MRETDLERKIAGIVRSKGGLCLKWVSPGFTGVPDRICILPGSRVLFIEVKSPSGKGRLSERQKRVAEQLRDLGCTVLVVESLEELDGYL